MGTVTNIADFRARKQSTLVQRAAALTKPALTKEDIAKGVVEAYRAHLGNVKRTGLNSAVRLICVAGVRAIIKRVRDDEEMIDNRARFQFFGVKHEEEFVVFGRVNLVCEVGSLAPPRSKTYRFDAATNCAFPLSALDNMSKNNTSTSLITLPASDFYNL